MFRATARTPRRSRPARVLVVGALLAFVAPFVVAPAAADAAPAKAALKITTTTLPAPIAGAPYSAPLAATGGTAPYHWSLASGKLPKGLTLSSVGAIAGTAHASGTATFTVKVTDSAKPVAGTQSRGLALDVGPEQVYVANQGANTVTEYGLEPKGDAPPVASISGPTTGPTAPGAIAVGPDGDVYVVDTGEQAISVYAPGATNQPPLRTLTGPDTNLTNPSGLAFDTHGDLYVANHGMATITEYLPGAGGDSAPTATIDGPDTGLVSLGGIAIDQYGRIYVGSREEVVSVFAPDSFGGRRPLFELGGDATRIVFAEGLAFDATGNLDVLNRSQAGSAVLQFAAGATGDVAPIGAIAGADTRLLNPGGIAFDGFGRLYVTNQDTLDDLQWVSVYPQGATGDAEPVAVLQGTRTGLNEPAGIAIGNPLVITTTEIPLGQVGTPYSATFQAALGVAPYHWAVFSGALPPGLKLSGTGKLSGTPTTVGVSRFSVAVRDSAAPNATLDLQTFTINVGVPLGVYVANSSLSSNSVVAYVGGGANNGPTITIAGPNTGISQPQALTFDSTARLYVANYDGSITEYPPDADGDVTPIATIAGSNTGLYTPSAITVDQSGDAFVANELGGTVTEYAPGANGNVAPIATITGLDDPAALAIDPEGRLWVNSADVLEAFAPGATGAATPVATIGGADTGLGGIHGIVFDADGWLHVSNVNNGTVTSYEPTLVGDVVPYATNAVSVPWGEAVDDFGDYAVVSDASPYSVIAFSRDGVGGVVIAQGDQSMLSQPTGIAVPPV